MANRLDGITSVFNTSLNNEIQDNLVEFFDWGLLERGNYFNVTLNETQDGIDYSLLKLSEDTNFEKGTVWEGFRKNWVWQSGITYYPQPIVATNNAFPGLSGIYIDDSFYPVDTSGDYSYYIDYYNGRVIFNSPIPTGSKVQAEYSYRYINVIYANSLPWVREIQYNSLFPDKSQSNIPAEASVELPAIAIEVVPKRTMKGLQLGGGQFINTDVLFHCIAEDEYTRNNLIDIVSFQNDKVIYLFNSNALSNNKKLPIDYRGVPVSGALRYPDIIDKYKLGKLRFKDVLVQNMALVNTNFYAGIVRMTAETVETFSIFNFCEDIQCPSGNNYFYIDATHFNYSIAGGSWISTDITFNSGDVISISATGCANCDITTGNYCKTGPDGMNTGEGSTYLESDNSQTFYGYNTLIGRINQNNTVFSKSFKVGSDYTGLCPLSGVLELAIYDTLSTDNSGGYCVYINLS
ncbi:MAG: hypothetical protein EBU90_05890 [Proteobacteria bacterium]|nr:hypothetical protein [Pseudomonadota bacterium]NBP15040.1 hypothetical protein [bacterium]